MTDDEFDAVGREIIGDRYALLGIGDVVAELDRQLLAENAAGGVDISGRLLDAVLHLRAGCGIGTCDWAADPELDLRYGGFRERECEAQGETERGDPLHLLLHSTNCQSAGFTGG